VEEEVPRGAEGTEGAEGADQPAAPDGIPPLPPELSAREQELRALIDAGAGSPEELRELAAKLKEQRTYEESVWAREVKPALIQSKKKKPSIVDLRREGVESDRNSMVLGLVLLVALLVLIVIATQTSFLLLLVGAAGVLVYAWFHGRQRADPGPDPAPPDPPPSGTTD